MQAARGTPLTPDDPADVRVAAYPRPRTLFWSVAAAAYALDVGSKVLAVEYLAGRPEVAVAGSWLRLNLVRNPGAAFSTVTGFTPLLTVIAVLTVAAVWYFSRRLGSRSWAVALGLLLAGVGGNLTDRLLRTPGPFRGHVVDFLQLPHWPVFNVADMCINAAAAVIVVQSLRDVRIDGASGQGRQTGGG
jgi:signal peptidase II